MPVNGISTTWNVFLVFFVLFLLIFMLVRQARHIAYGQKYKDMIVRRTLILIKKDEIIHQV